MGSGGLVVMDETTCMVDVARFFLDFTQRESCGKCTFCRIGTKRMLEVLTRITEGKGQDGDIELLEELAARVKNSSLCGLGQTAPNPVLTTLKYFRSEYEAHITNKKCPAHHCQKLLTYTITDDCSGCMLCLKACAVGAITGERKKMHVIDQAKCTVCGECYKVVQPRRDSQGLTRVERRHAMALVKLEIDGKRIIADGSQTILAGRPRSTASTTIPTLCHDEQLEPFASCFVCVVKVKGARSLLPACSTKVTNGMVVETNTAEVRQSRKAALELLLSNHYADCVGPCQLVVPGRRRHPGLHRAGRDRASTSDAIALIKENNPLPSVCGRVCTRPCEVKGCRRDAARRGGRHRLHQALHQRPRPGQRRRLAARRSRRPTASRWRSSARGPRGSPPPTTSRIKGYAVDIFEAQPEPGGMLRYGIPEYRLPKDVLDLEIDADPRPRRDAEDQHRPRQGLHRREPEGAGLRRRSSWASARGAAR